MSKSIKRVQRIAESLGLSITIKRMGQSTRTAQEAADQCNCEVRQIIKSLIFEGAESGKLYLFLVPGDRQLDLEKGAACTNEQLQRADPRKIRDETGFAIGGVSPIGYERPIPVFADDSLQKDETVWAAAGAHDAVFSINALELIAKAGFQSGDIVAHRDKESP